MISPAILRRFPFFGFMSEEQLKAVAMIANELTLEKNEVIVEAGKPAENFFYLIEGDIAYYSVATSEHDPYYKREYFITDINPGEVFGISALIEPHVYTATLKADKVSRVIKFDAPALRTMCEVDLKLSCELHRDVAKAAMERLKYTQIELAAARV